MCHLHSPLLLAASWRPIGTNRLLVLYRSIREENLEPRLRFEKKKKNKGNRNKGSMSLCCSAKTPTFAQRNGLGKTSRNSTCPSAGGGGGITRSPWELFLLLESPVRLRAVLVISSAESHCGVCKKAPEKSSKWNPGFQSVIFPRRSASTKACDAREVKPCRSHEIMKLLVSGKHRA